MSWWKAFQIYRFLRLSCKVGLHLTMDGAWDDKCWHETRSTQSFPIWST